MTHSKRQLRADLSKIFSNVNEIRILANDGTVNTAGIDFARPGDQVWTQVLEEALKQPAVWRELWDVLLERYPGNSTLKAYHGQADAILQELTGALADDTSGASAGAKGSPVSPDAESSKPTRILLLAANPGKTPRLRLDQEVTDIENGIARGQQRQQLSFTPKHMVSWRDMRRAVQENAPTILHFSGHGEASQGIVLENQGEPHIVPWRSVSSLCRSVGEMLECVVLNACYTADIQASLGQEVDYFVGTTDAITDVAAREFAVGFYDVLARGGKIEEAFESGKLAAEAFVSGEGVYHLGGRKAPKTP